MLLVGAMEVGAVQTAGGQGEREAAQMKGRKKHIAYSQVFDAHCYAVSSLAVCYYEWGFSCTTGRGGARCQEEEAIFGSQRGSDSRKVGCRSVKLAVMVSGQS